MSFDKKRFIMNLEIIKYTDDWEKRWDRFVDCESVNGTFLQTKRFLNYHPDGRFKDSSLIVLQGTNIVAVIPACEIIENEVKCFYSHKGSTFGGIIVERQKYNITTLEELFECFEKYLEKQGYGYVYMKSTSDVFAKESSELLNYFFYKNDYKTVNELSFFIDCKKIDEDITKTWVVGRRRDYKYSLRNNLVFRKLNGDDELLEFYEMLKENLSRHGTKPVHTLEELKEFRDTRLINNVDFYGVFYQKELAAGTMLFYFNTDVLHTQYLAQLEKYKGLYTMNFLNYNLINLAKSHGFRKFSFGISTENSGKILNKGLAVFKEGFGTQFCNNRSHYKKLKKIRTYVNGI